MTVTSIIEFERIFFFQEKTKISKEYLKQKPANTFRIFKIKIIIL